MLFSRNDRNEASILKSLRLRVTTQKKRSQRRTPRRLSLEGLELRTLMSATPLCMRPELGYDAAPALMAQAENPVLNLAPVAGNDAYAIRAHQQLGANVLINDSDAEGDPLCVVLAGEPGHGTLLLAPDGTFTYAPHEGFEGVDLFSYRASDGQGESAEATVSIIVTSGVPNTAPTAEADEYRVDEDQVLSVGGAGLLGNDSDADGDTLRAVLVGAPRHGMLVLGRDGSFDYTPRADFFGIDTFSYKVNDGETDSEVAAVTITVDAVNDAPLAKEDHYATPENESLVVDAAGVLANDQDPEGDALGAVLVAGPANGSLELNADGSFTYTPNPGFEGEDSFSYVANDGQLDSDPATVAIVVAHVNAAPLATADAYTTPAGHVLAVDAAGVLANDQDPEGDALAAVLVAGPANGSLELKADGSFTYTPNAGFQGEDSFSYVASDGQLDSDPATVAIAVAHVNAAPLAAADVYTTPAGHALSVDAAGVLANDQDPEGDALAAVLVAGPANGSLELKADGSFTYTPSAGFQGEDTFVYLASDGQLVSDPATVSLVVQPAVDAAKELVIHLEISGTAFGLDSGAIWGGATFWVNAYVEDRRDLPQGVVGGAIDLAFDSLHVAPTGHVAYGDAFVAYRQGTVDAAAGVIDEAGALATEGGVGAGARAPFMAWQFRRSGPGAPDDPNSQVTFAADPGEGTATIRPAEFALVGDGAPLDWANVQFDAASVNLYLGDFNGDGRVNHCDLALWIPQAISSHVTGNASCEFDLNADARVDAVDLALLMPRLYQPVLGDNPSADNDAPAANFHARNAARRHARECTDAPPAQLRAGPRCRTMAVDLAFQEPGHWLRG